MPVEAEAVYSSGEIDNPDDRKSKRTKRGILHMRHRVGDYDVTRLILGATDDIERCDK